MRLALAAVLLLAACPVERSSTMTEKTEHAAAEPTANVKVSEADVMAHALAGAARARMLAAMTDGQRWSADLEAGTLTVGDQVYHPQMLGTYSPREKTFLWAWANPSLSDLEPVLRASKALQAMGKQPGRGVFRSSDISAESQSWKVVAWVSGELSGGAPAFMADSGGGTMAVMLLEEVKLELSTFPLALLSGVLLEAQAEARMPLRAAMAPFFAQLGLSVEATQQGIVGKRSDGSKVTVQFDAAGRVADIALTVVPAPK